MIIDSPPTQAVSDAKILSSLSDAVIYVVRADSTAVQVAEKGVGDLLQSGAPLLGAALNQINPSRSQQEGYTYGGYYADDSESPST